MFVAVATRTMQGAARRAKEREQGALAIMEPPKPECAPTQAPVANNVVPLVIPRTDAQQIIADVAHKHGLTYADLLSKSRSRRLIPARFDAIAAVKIAKPHLSLPQIGKLFNRDFSTIAHALRQRGWK